MEMVVLLHEQEISCRENYYNHSHIQIMVDGNENEPGGYYELQCHIEQRNSDMRNLQLIGHELVCVFAVRLAKVFMELYAVTDSQYGIGTVDRQEGEIREVSGLDNEFAECEQQYECDAD